MNKFKLGDKVKVTHPTMNNWHGIVYGMADTGEGWEYSVTNAPCILNTKFPVLAWESEMSIDNSFEGNYFAS